MILYGKLVLGTKVLKEASFEVIDENISFRDRLEECLIGLCKELDIPVPLWLKKNTKEFIHYRTTFFFREQFVESIKFDKFEIRLS